jgi:hypothetical protein
MSEDRSLLEYYAISTGKWCPYCNGQAAHKGVGWLTPYDEGNTILWHISTYLLDDTALTSQKTWIFSTTDVRT